MDGSAITPVMIVLACASGGVLAGAGGRRLLGRLPRGATVRAAWCETAVGLLWTVSGVGAVGSTIPPWWAPITMALAWFGVLLTVTDLAHRRLPDALTLPAYPVVGVLLCVAVPLGAGWELGLRALVGSVVFLGVHAAVHFVAPGSLGGGDVKLAGSLGAVLGALGWLALVLAAVLAALCSLGLRLAGPLRWRDAVPHGPGLLAATWVLAAFPGAGVLVP